MVARTVLTKREDADIERIRKGAETLASNSPETAEAAERISTIRGPDEVHTRVFRIGAIADLVEAVVEAQQKPEAKVEAETPAKPQARKPPAKPRKSKS